MGNRNGGQGTGNRNGEQERGTGTGNRNGEQERETGTGNRERGLGNGSLGIQNSEFMMEDKGKKGTIWGNARKWVSWIHRYFDNVVTKFVINNRTDELFAEAAFLLVSTKNCDLWFGPTPDVCDSRTC